MCRVKAHETIGGENQPTLWMHASAICIARPLAGIFWGAGRTPQIAVTGTTSTTANLCLEGIIVLSSYRLKAAAYQENLTH
jgi:hypothetical protein